MKLEKKIKTVVAVFMLINFVLIDQTIIIAQSDADYKIIKEANKAYTSADYQKAANLYESIVKKGYSASELHFNLGNAYYRLGDYKSAILNYERAKLLNPEDENIQINLDFAQRYIQDKIEVAPKFILVRWLNAFIDMFSANIWSIISIFCFILLLTMVLFFLFSKKVSLRKLSIYIGFFSIIISLISFYCASKQNRKLTSHHTAIIFSQAVTVKSSPNQSGTDLFIIHEGLKVTITGKSDGWREIKLSDGKIGWLPEEAIEEI